MQDEGVNEKANVIAIQSHARPGINTDDALGTERNNSKTMYHITRGH